MTLSSEGSGKEGAVCMSSCGVLREVEAYSGPPTPALSTGKRVSGRFVFTGFWIRRVEATRALRCRLEIRVGEFTVKSEKIFSCDWNLRRDDSAVKNDYRAPANEDIDGSAPAAARRNGQVEAMTTHDALLEQISTVCRVSLFDL
ncbi:Uncharacterized protein Rs2_03877 [Raphanus sativus]|nr:Uncharacterized protein Rs2_03877 [Raphanus sativus]